MENKILIVEDERSIGEILKYGLEKDGYEVELAYNGEKALEKVNQQDFALVLLDIMLPGKDGFQVCREIRSSFSNLPIIMITAKEEEVDKILGLELGADDYITKPFSVREVIARVKAVLRRTSEPVKSSQAILKSGEIEINLNTMEAFKNGREIELTFREFTLLTFLMQHKNHVFNRQQLLNEVWGYEYTGEDRTVDVMIRRLREKVEDDPAEPNYICTKRGMGYYFRRKE